MQHFYQIGLTIHLLWVSRLQPKSSWACYEGKRSENGLLYLCSYITSIINLSNSFRTFTIYYYYSSMLIPDKQERTKEREREGSLPSPIFSSVAFSSSSADISRTKRKLYPIDEKLRKPSNRKRNSTFNSKNSSEATTKFWVK